MVLMSEIFNHEGADHPVRRKVVFVVKVIKTRGVKRFVQ